MTVNYLNILALGIKTLFLELASCPPLHPLLSRRRQGGGSSLAAFPAWRGPGEEAAAVGSAGRRPGAAPPRGARRRQGGEDSSGAQQVARDGAMAALEMLFGFLHFRSSLQ